MGLSLVVALKPNLTRRRAVMSGDAETACSAWMIVSFDMSSTAKLQQPGKKVLLVVDIGNQRPQIGRAIFDLQPRSPMMPKFVRIYSAN